MSHWKNPIVNLGAIKAGTPVKITFVALSTIPKIKAVKPYCGCTASKYDETKKELNVTYSNRAIASHVGPAPQGIAKRIDIEYENGTVEVLTIKGSRLR
jgi:hypothetical protein